MIDDLKKMETEAFLWEYLQTVQKPVVIYGMGDGCEKILAACKQYKIPVRGIFASDEYVRKKVFHGFEIQTFSEIKERLGDAVILLAFGAFQKEWIDKIRALAQENELYAPDVPLFGGALFDRAFLEQNRSRIEAAYALLADDFSKKVYENLLRFKLSGKIAYLLDVQTEKSEVFERLIPFSANDVFVDLGAYNGDTALEFAEMRHGEYREIIAFEPNHKSFLKLLENTRSLLRCRAVEAAAWSRNETLFLNGKTGRSAAIERNGKTEVRAVRVDETVPVAHHIKFDVEGAEKEAIEGCEGIIRRARPSLWISAYHRTEDLFELPLQVQKIAPYRFHLRHHPYLPAWDTVYYCTPK